MFYRKNKFNAQRTKSGFPSKLEESVYHLLNYRAQLGEISELRRQHTIFLTEAKISYKVDFSYIENGKLVFVEAKGIETGEFRIKKKLWRFYGPGNLEIFKGDYRRPYLDEVIKV